MYCKFLPKIWSLEFGILRELKNAKDWFYMHSSLFTFGIQLSLSELHEKLTMQIIFKWKPIKWNKNYVDLQNYFAKLQF